MPKPKIEWRIDDGNEVYLMLPTGDHPSLFNDAYIGGFMDLQHLMTELHDRILPEVEAEIDRREK